MMASMRTKNEEIPQHEEKSLGDSQDVDVASFATRKDKVTSQSSVRP